MSLKIAWARLHRQRLASGRLTRPEDVVALLGAVQAQEYPFAKWGLGLRLRRATDASVERAFATGKILRTHVLRPTWHFVTPRDIRWLLALTGPRVRAVVAYHDRSLGITPAVVRRANRAMANALAGGAELTRLELKAVLERSSVRVDGTQRLAQVIMNAELDAVICSGARRGKQFTYALLDERVPPAPLLSRDDGLAELARRYFTGHGPAQLADFVWWSGLTVAEARSGLEMARPQLVEEEIEGRRYWRSDRRSLPPSVRSAWLLPPYDEYLIGYKDRSAAVNPAIWRPSPGRDPFLAPVVLDGSVIGGWRRALGEASVLITLGLPGGLGRAEARLVEDAARRYAGFLGLDAVVARR
jgi:hypothetical protein